MELLRHDKEKHERVSIAGVIFLVDHSKQELRQKGQPSNRIPFEKLKANQNAEGISIVFDRLTRNLYEGYIGKEGLPLSTERVSLSSSLLVDRKNPIKSLSAGTASDNIRQWQQGACNPTQRRVKKRKSLGR